MSESMMQRSFFDKARDLGNRWVDDGSLKKTQVANALRDAALLFGTPWIPVTERLPRVTERVLIWSNVSHTPSWGACLSIEPDRRKGVYKWIMMSMDCEPLRLWHKDCEHIKVTHWAPLLSPPKEGE